MAKEFELQQLQQQQQQSSNQFSSFPAQPNPAISPYTSNNSQAAAYYSAFLENAGLMQQSSTATNSRSPHTTREQQSNPDIRMSPFLMAAAAAASQHHIGTGPLGNTEPSAANNANQFNPKTNTSNAKQAQQQQQFPGNMPIEYMNQMMMAGFNPMAGFERANNQQHLQQQQQHQQNPFLHQYHIPQQPQQHTQKSVIPPSYSNQQQQQQQQQLGDQASQLVQQHRQQLQQQSSSSLSSSDNEQTSYHTGFTEFQDISRILWTGSFMIKNDTATIAMNYVSGNINIARNCLSQMTVDSQSAPLRILQRMRLEQSQLEGVQRKLQSENEHCVLIAVPYGMNSLEQMTQTACLRNGFINYLLEKRAAGIVNVSVPNASYVVHIFPPCEFTNETLRVRNPDFSRRLGDYTHLFIVIATV